MQNIYNPHDAQAFIHRYGDTTEALAHRTYTSRLIGANPNLVLHGGGNTSVKVVRKNILGEDQEFLFVKGSGVDLSRIEPWEFVALDLAFLRKLRGLKRISDDDMQRQLQIRKLRPSPLHPSVEALLHAFLPHKYVDHTHADSILMLTNQKNGPDLVREALGPDTAILPYIMSGLPLAREVASQYEMNPQIKAIVIVNHGIFTFDDTAERSYGRMVECVRRADMFISQKLRRKRPPDPGENRIPAHRIGPLAARIAQMVRGMCAHRRPNRKWRRFNVAFRNTPDLVAASLAREARGLCLSGVLTPDHVIRTKDKFIYIEAVPEDENALRGLLSQKIDDYVKAYHRYFQAQIAAHGSDRRELDPYPRVFLVAGLGLFSLGFSPAEAGVAGDIATHNIKAKLKIGAMGTYVPISDAHIFDMEYWSLQQKKLATRTFPLLQGQVALITGGGGAIGYGIADRLLAAGAAVVLSDIDVSRLRQARNLLQDRYPRGRVDVCPSDVTDLPSLEAVYEDISRRLGGIDIVVPNAGIAHVATLEELEPDRLDRVMAVNYKGTFNTIKAAIPVFKRQRTGGNIVIISSKNVFDPGAAFGAYSASKAAAHQISKIAAMELAGMGVRVNMINPDAVFGTEAVSSKLWDLIGPDRMRSRGLDFEGLKGYYRKRNLLKVEVLAEHVGNAVVFFAGDYTPTTGASLPVDGGIPAAFPR